jgi:indolepyruvate decarboxylase
MTVAEALLHALKDRGAKAVFGIPGDFALPFFKVAETSEILPLFTFSHEPAVGFAADAAARMSGGLGVAAVTYGAGALNMVNPVAQAYAEKSPLVVISGAPGAEEGGRGLGLHHQVKRLDSQLAIYREVTCAQAVLNDAETAPDEIARVLDTALTRSLPVYIEIPRDMVNVDCATVPQLSSMAANLEAAADCAAEICAQLEIADAPALLLGVEIRRYGLEDKVAELARTLGIPTTTTFMGRGLLAESDAPLIGTYLGLAGTEGTRRSVERSDGLLMLGVILCDTNFGVSKRQIDMRRAVHAFDGSVRVGNHIYPDVTLEALVDALLDCAKSLGKSAPVTPYDYPTALVADDTPVRSIDIACAINDMFAKHGRMPISSDTGDCLFTAMDIENTALVASGYYATMGPGVPAGMGIQATSGQRPLILVGDGAFQMTGWELGNCKKYGLTPIVIVFNNCSWDMLRMFQPSAGYHDLADWKFADIAPSLGGIGTRVSTREGLINALETAVIDTDNFHLIEVMLERGKISPTLQRFVDTMKERSALRSEE